jgi:serine/threonine protein kinase
MVGFFDGRQGAKTFHQLLFQVTTKKELDLEQLSPDQELRDFINYCCIFDKNSRPSSQDLLDHPFLK